MDNNNNNNNNNNNEYLEVIPGIIDSIGDAIRYAVIEEIAKLRNELESKRESAGEAEAIDLCNTMLLLMQLLIDSDTLAVATIRAALDNMPGEVDQETLERSGKNNTVDFILLVSEGISERVMNDTTADDDAPHQSLSVFMQRGGVS